MYGERHLCMCNLPLPAYWTDFETFNSFWQYSHGFKDYWIFFCVFNVPSNSWMFDWERHLPVCICNLPLPALPAYVLGVSAYLCAQVRGCCTAAWARPCWVCWQGGGDDLDLTLCCCRGTRSSWWRTATARPPHPEAGCCHWSSGGWVWSPTRWWATGATPCPGSMSHCTPVTKNNKQKID